MMLWLPVKKQAGSFLYDPGKACKLQAWPSKRRRNVAPTLGLSWAQHVVHSTALHAESEKSCSRSKSDKL